MQRDDWYRGKRDPADLPAGEPIGDYAGAARAVAARRARIGTRQAPVLFEAPQAAMLLGSFVHAVSGGNLYRKASLPRRSAGPPGLSECGVISRKDRSMPSGLASAVRRRGRARRRATWCATACCRAISFG